jgi:hypothetical protein
MKSSNIKSHFTRSSLPLQRRYQSDHEIFSPADYRRLYISLMLDIWEKIIYLFLIHNTALCHKQELISRVFCNIDKSSCLVCLERNGKYVSLFVYAVNIHKISFFFRYVLFHIQKGIGKILGDELEQRLKHLKAGLSDENSGL